MTLTPSITLTLAVTHAHIFNLSHSLALRILVLFTKFQGKAGTLQGIVRRRGQGDLVDFLKS